MSSTKKPAVEVVSNGQQIAVTNNSQQPIYRYGSMIAPNETQLFEKPNAPAPVTSGVSNPDAVVIPQVEGMAALLLESVKTIEAELPLLSDEDLQQLEQLEEAKGEDHRTTLLKAINKEQVERADLRVFEESLVDKTASELSDLLIDYDEGSARYGVIAERLDTEKKEFADSLQGFDSADLNELLAEHAEDSAEYSIIAELIAALANDPGTG